jgi:hypothetical protein
METISDKEVGELWRMFLGCCERGTDDEAVNAGVLLVRKLVQERVNRYVATGGWKNETSMLPAALRDFGISPAEWEHPNG